MYDHSVVGGIAMKTTFRVILALLLSLSLYLCLIPGAWAENLYTMDDLETFDSGDAPGPFTVYFSANGGSGHLTSPITKAKGETMILPTYGDVYRQNHTLLGWNNDPNGYGVHYDPGAVYTFYEDETLYAEWDVRISYYANASEATGGPMVATAVSGDNVTLSWNEYTRPGYKFIGWNTNSDGSGTSYSDGQTLRAPKYDMNLYAQWVKSPIVVHFDSNGGAGVMISQEIDVVTESWLKLSKNTFTKPAYSFICWNTKADGSGTNYDDEETIPASSITDDITLYAQWATAILFDGNGASSGSMDPQHFTLKDPAEIITLNRNEFVRTNYRFNSWNTKADGTGTSYPDKGDYSASTSVTLYAQWKRSAFTVSYDPNGGGGTMEADNVNVGQSVKLKDSTFSPKPGQIFAGWKDENGEDHAVGDSFQPEDDITMYAQWKDIIKVNYHPDINDSTFKTVEIPKETDTKVKLPTDPELDFSRPSGKTFAYWLDKTTNKHYTKNDVLNLTSDIDLYAVYADTVSVTYNANGGTVAPNDSSTAYKSYKASAPKGEDYTLYTADYLALTRKGYEFKGWGQSEADKSPDYTDGGTYKFNNDTEIFAIWEKHTFDGSVSVLGELSSDSYAAYVGETLTAYPYDDFWKEFNYKWVRSDGKVLLDSQNPPANAPEGYDYSNYPVQPEDYGYDIYCVVTAVGDDSHTEKRSNVKTVAIKQDETIRIVNRGYTESGYVYGLTKDMKYTINSTDSSKAKPVSLIGSAFEVDQPGTYRFYKDGTLQATVYVENWWTIGYASSGSGTVRLALDNTTLTSATRFNAELSPYIEYYNKLSGYTCWIVKEGAKIGTFTLTVTPASGNYAHVYLNEKLLASFGSTTTTRTTTNSNGTTSTTTSSTTSSTSTATYTRTFNNGTPLDSWKMYDVVFNNSTTSPRTADESNLGLWSALCMTSLTGAAVILTETRKRRKNAK